MHTIPEESYLELKNILEKQNYKTYTMEEVKKLVMDF